MLTNHNLYIFLSITVADTAARPLHSVYDLIKLKKYIKNKKNITFLLNNKSSFYDIKIGNIFDYNDVSQVMFKSLLETNKNSNILANFKLNIVQNFGLRSKYWKI